MATYQVTSPDPFSFSKPEEWPKWLRRFERFKNASGLDDKPEVAQVNTLIYTMGDEADDILRSFQLSADDSKLYKVVSERFNSHFVKRRNVIYERAKFNFRRQEEGESVDTFITDLYALAEHCGYGALHDEMIRDKIVVGIRNAKLSERLQLDSELTLEKAITSVRQTESIHQQQPLLRGSGNETKQTVGAVNAHKKAAPPKGKSTQGGHGHTTGVTTCSRCGKSPSHEIKSCPANDAICRKCKRRGHYQRVCRSAKVASVQQHSQEDDSDDDSVFLGGVSSNVGSPWRMTLQLNSHPVEFCIDTGAEVTVIPEHTYELIGSPDLLSVDKDLKGPSGELLQASGRFLGTFQKKNLSVKQSVYVVKHLHKPLLGRPAIERLGLITWIDTVVETGHQNPVDRFSHLFRGLGKLDGDYTIRLQEGAKPFALSTARRVPVPLLKSVKEELERMEELGVIAKVKDPTDWCAGMVTVPKKDGKVRICVDLTRLNKSVLRERHPLPAVEQVLAQLTGAKVFSKLDANSGFWQIPLAPESALLTTFITPFGRYYFHRLPFGITSAPEHFQRRVSEVLSGIKGVVGMTDDVLVFGENQEEHDKHLTEALKRIEQAGLTLNREKCQFSKDRVTFLGQVVDGSGIHPDPGKVSAIKKVREPRNVSDVRRFLGMLNQMSKFVPNLADKTKPLRELLHKDSLWTWEQPQREAFASAKELLSTAPVLALYDPNAETIVSADASSYGIGAVLFQRQTNGDLKPIAYISRSLSPTEERYAQIEKEALAFTWACERLSDYLIGIKFHIQTDHKPLVPLFSTKHLEDLPIRVQRFRLRMMRFDFTIAHVPGKDLVMADALSRAPSREPNREEQIFQQETRAFIDTIVQSLPATEERLAEIKACQEKDPVCKQIVEYCQTGWPDKKSVIDAVKPYFTISPEISIHEDLLMRGNRIIIPITLQKSVLTQLHTGHQGIRKCRERARQSVWWPTNWRTW